MGATHDGALGGRRTILMLTPRGASKLFAKFTHMRNTTLSRHWEFFSAEIYRSDSGNIKIARASQSAATIRDLAGVLRPDGVIAWGSVVSPKSLRAEIGGNQPMVFIDSEWDTQDDPARRSGNVKSDPASIAQIASRALLLPQRCEDFAFVPFPGNHPWSIARGKAFANAIDLAGKRLHRFDWPAGSAGPADSGETLGRWIGALPRPCGIFAANDSVAEQVLGACSRTGISVPNDIAVVGADNFTHVCESTSPTLSSIEMDVAAECDAAVELMGKLFQRRSGGSPPELLVPAKQLVQRASSRFIHDRRVAAALEFIRLNACNEGFSPRDVVREMGVSRALAFPLFHHATGRTILDEIHAVRLNRARELLATGMPQDAVGAACGYASHDDFRRVFRKRIGTTARKWALQHR